MKNLQRVVSYLAKLYKKDPKKALNFNKSWNLLSNKDIHEYQKKMTLLKNQRTKNLQMETGEIL